tara:strand:+ start:916 stop:1017 length:102 start_codon:yes stop_codon:yes gene_type:complete
MRKRIAARASGNVMLALAFASIAALVAADIVLF